MNSNNIKVSFFSSKMTFILFFFICLMNSIHAQLTAEIGKSDYPKPFTTHQIEYKENTSFYLFTDGIADQFGGPNGKKFKYKQFSNLLIKNNNLSQKHQADIINKVFSDWKGELEQVDDVCVIGIKI